MKLKSSCAGQAYETLLGDPSFISALVQPVMLSNREDEGLDRDVRKQR